MKKRLLAVLLALSFAGCSDNDINDNHNTTADIEAADDSFDSNASTSDPFDNGPIVTPSNTTGERYNASRFVTRFDSTKSYDF